ncbi:MAG: HAD family hydrolase [Lachnospiraceae bacterium]|nr:HAD family hydrolase [Lachnospiraceae bacterium]
MKLVFIDLDDTLLCKDKTITEENRNTIKEALDKGNVVSICSGRSLHGGMLAIKELGITHKNLYQIGYHGGMARNVMSGEILAKNPMDIDGAIAVLEEALKRNIFAIAFTEFGIYVPNEGDDFKRYIRITNESHMVYKNPMELKEKNVCVYKILLSDFFDHEKLVSFQNDFGKKEEENNVKSFFSCLQYLEFVRSDVDKGLGLRTLTNSLGEKIENTVAIGDERNDISMIKAASIGCAMRNAHPDVKDIADVILENDNENSGVAEAIKRFVL